MIEIRSLQWLLNLLILALASCILVAWRTHQVFSQMKRNRRKRKSHFHSSRGQVRTLVVLGSGGHTTEMLHLLSSITFVRSKVGSEPNKTVRRFKYAPLNYIIASSDTTSIAKLKSFDAQQPPEKKLLPHDSVYSIPRARHVGQSYISSIFTTLGSLLATARVVLVQTQPDLLLMNGPGTCLPIAIWTIVGRILGICGGRIIFCESFCRVKSLSLTGRILYSLGMVDLFLVHWEELAEHLNGPTHGDDKEAECFLLESFTMKSCEREM